MVPRTVVIEQAQSVSWPDGVVEGSYGSQALLL